MGGGQLQRDGWDRRHTAVHIGASPAGRASPIRVATGVPRHNPSARRASARGHCADASARRAADARGRGANASARRASVYNCAAACGISSGVQGPATGHRGTGPGATSPDVPRGGV